MQTLASNLINPWRLLTVPAIIKITKKLRDESRISGDNAGNHLSEYRLFLSRGHDSIRYLPEQYWNRSA